MKPTDKPKMKEQLRQEPREVEYDPREYVPPEAEREIEIMPSDVTHIPDTNSLQCNICGTVIPFGWNHSCTPEAEKLKELAKLIESKDREIEGLNFAIAKWKDEEKMWNENYATLRAENERLRNALEKIANSEHDYDNPIDGFRVAKEALRGDSQCP